MSANFDLLDVDSVLVHTQGLRMRIINKLMESERGLPEDVKEQVTLLKAIDGLDKAVVTKRRLGIEEAAQQTDELEARNSTEILRAIKQHAFSMSGYAEDQKAPSTDDIPEPILRPGETDIGTAEMNYETFMNNSKQAPG